MCFRRLLLVGLNVVIWVCDLAYASSIAIWSLAVLMATLLVGGTFGEVSVCNFFQFASALGCSSEQLPG